MKARCRSLAFTFYNAFLKNKKGTTLPAPFSEWFLHKIFLLLYSINWPNFIVWLSLIWEILSNMCIVIICNQAVTSSLFFTNKPRQKFKSWERKKLLRGCSYGGELARLGGLGRLSEISPSLRNSNKNIMYSYEKWTSLPRWDLTWFCRDPT